MQYKFPPLLGCVWGPSSIEWGASAFANHVDLPDYTLNIAGMAASYDNCVELSYAHQRFDLGSLVHKRIVFQFNCS